MQQPLLNRPGSSRTGKYVLSLDGGGFRGLSELQLLKGIVEMINPEDPPKPCEIFDMIGGTSTGGLIAIMLGRLKMSVDECIAKYEKISPKAFSKVQHRLSWRGQVQGRFDSAALELEIKSLLVSKELDEDTLLKAPSSSEAPKTLVCCTSQQTGGTVVLSSYLNPYRGTELLNITKMWEAARATSAASSFFDSITIGDEDFVDGATGANNPIGEIWTEAGDIWREDHSWVLEDHVNCLLSLGTGVPSLKPFGADPLQIGKTILAIAMDSGKKWEEFAKQHPKMLAEGRTFRFNVEHGLETVGLEEIKKVKEIKAATRNYMQSAEVRSRLTACAENLRAAIVSHPFWSFLPRWKASLALNPKLYSQEPISHDANQLREIRYRLQWLTNTLEYYDWRTKGEAGDRPIIWHGVENSPISLSHDIASHLISQSGGTDNVRPEVLLVEYPTGDPIIYLGRILEAIQRSSPTESHSLRLFDKRYHRHLRTTKSVMQNGVVTFADVSDSLLYLLSHTNADIALVFAITERLSLEQADYVRAILHLVSAYSPVKCGTASAKLIVVAKDDAIVRDVLRGCVAINTDTELNQCLDTLQFGNMSRRRDNIVRAEEGTFDWIWSHPSFLNWMEQPASMLWIEGKPGSGKSVLARHIEQYLATKTSTTASTKHGATQLVTKYNIAAWYFSAREGIAFRDHGNMLRGLLFQLLEQDHSLFWHFMTPFRRRQKVQDMHQWTWHAQDMQNILRSIAERSVSPPICMIDGLDESDEIDTESIKRSSIISSFRDLAKPGVGMHILLLSRPTIEISKALRWVHRLSMQAENLPDVKVLADRRLAALKSLCKDITSDEPDGVEESIGELHHKYASLMGRERDHKFVNSLSRVQGQQQKIEDTALAEIGSYVVEHADGVLLWVTLVFASLEALVMNAPYSIADLRQEILKIPSDLNGVYRKIILELKAKLPDSALSKTRGMFQWLSAATSVQPLEMQQLWEALALPLDNDHSKSGSSDLEIMERRLVLRPLDPWGQLALHYYHLCGPLIEILPSDPVQGMHKESFNIFKPGPHFLVRFVHKSVKEYLENESLATDWYLPSVESSEVVRNCLVRYVDVTLSYRLGAKDQTSGEGEMCSWSTQIPKNIRFIEDHPLLVYILEAYSDIFLQGNSAWQDIYDNTFLPPLSRMTQQQRGALGLGIIRDLYSSRLFHIDFERHSVIGHYFEQATASGAMNALRFLITTSNAFNLWLYRGRDAALYGTLRTAAASGLLPEVKKLTHYGDHRISDDSGGNKYEQDSVIRDIYPLILHAARAGEEECTQTIIKDADRLRAMAEWSMIPVAGIDMEMFERPQEVEHYCSIAQFNGHLRKLARTLALSKIQLEEIMNEHEAYARFLIPYLEEIDEHVYEELVKQKESDPPIPYLDVFVDCALNLLKGILVRQLQQSGNVSTPSLEDIGIGQDFLARIQGLHLKEKHEVHAASAAFTIFDRLRSLNINLDRESRNEMAAYLAAEEEKGRENVRQVVQYVMAKIRWGPASS